MEDKRGRMPFSVHWSGGGPFSSMDGHCPSCYMLAHAFKNRCLAQWNVYSFTGRFPEEGKWIFDLFVSFAFIYS